MVLAAEGEREIAVDVAVDDGGAKLQAGVLGRLTRTPPLTVLNVSCWSGRTVVKEAWTDPFTVRSWASAPNPMARMPPLTG